MGDAVAVFPCFRRARPRPLQQSQSCLVWKPSGICLFLIRIADRTDRAGAWRRAAKQAFLAARLRNKFRSRRRLIRGPATAGPANLRVCDPGARRRVAAFRGGVQVTRRRLKFRLADRVTEAAVAGGYGRPCRSSPPWRRPGFSEQENVCLVLRREVAEAGKLFRPPDRAQGLSRTRSSRRPSRRRRLEGSLRRPPARLVEARTEAAAAAFALRLTRGPGPRRTSARTIRGERDFRRTAALTMPTREALPASDTLFSLPRRTGRPRAESGGARGIFPAVFPAAGRPGDSWTLWSGRPSPITASFGSSGSAEWEEVYEAEDTDLGRHVAIKVLSDSAGRHSDARSDSSARRAPPRR